MIGYYVHHHGSGHVTRALEVARALGEPVTGLSSLPRPAQWPGPWIQLDSDADGSEDTTSASPRDRLHWVPLGHAGLRSRMGEIASWVRHVSPSVVVVDVSVEVATLVRLHGVPVVTLVQPGRRGDPAHVFGFDLADALVGCWPASATGMLLDVPEAIAARVEPVGGLSRHAPAETRGERRPGPCRVVLLSGTGAQDGTSDAAALDRARAETPGWEWTVLDKALGTWVDDPAPVLRDADVVVTHAGQNALAEVAAARRPAVVVPQSRPHAEQLTTVSVLRRGGWPVVTAVGLDQPGWAARLAQAASLDGARWAGWVDGQAAYRFAAIVRRTALS